METAIRCLNILSMTVMIVASIYAMTAFPWIASESVDVAVGVVVILSAMHQPRERVLRAPVR